jgi:tetratricopeptide (TPR) repeat protein
VGVLACSPQLPEELREVLAWEASDIGAAEPQIEAQFEEALASLRSAAESGVPEAELADGLGQLAMTYQIYRRPDRALVAYRLASEYDPREPRWWYYAALLHRSEGRIEAAESALVRCLDTGTDAIAPRLELADIVLNEGRVDQALTLYSELLERDPNSLRAQLGLAEVRLARGELEAALASLMELQEREPEAKLVRWVLGRALRQAGRLGEARNLLANGPPVSGRDRLGPPDPWMVELSRLDRSSQRQWAIGRFLQSQGRFEEAIALLENAIGHNSRVPAYWTDLGTTLARMDRGEEAFEAFAKALRLDPEYLPALAQLGSFQQSQGDLDGALETFDRILTLDARRPEILLGKAELQRLLGRPEEAISTLEHVLLLSVDDERALIGLARNLSTIGDSEGLEATIERGLRAHPESSWFRSLTLRNCAGSSPDCQESRAEAERQPKSAQPPSL